MLGMSSSQLTHSYFSKGSTTKEFVVLVVESPGKKKQESKPEVAAFVDTDAPGAVLSFAMNYCK